MTAHTERALKDLEAMVKWAAQMPRDLPLEVVKDVADETRLRKGILQIGLAADRQATVVKPRPQREMTQVIYAGAGR